MQFLLWFSCHQSTGTPYCDILALQFCVLHHKLNADHEPPPAITLIIGGPFFTFWRSKALTDFSRFLVHKTHHQTCIWTRVPDKSGNLYNIQECCLFNLFERKRLRYCSNGCITFVENGGVPGLSHLWLERMLMPCGHFLADRCAVMLVTNLQCTCTVLLPRTLRCCIEFTWKPPVCLGNMCTLSKMYLWECYIALK